MNEHQKLCQGTAEPHFFNRCPSTFCGLRAVPYKLLGPDSPLKGSRPSVLMENGWFGKRPVGSDYWRSQEGPLVTSVFFPPSAQVQMTPRQTCGKVVVLGLGMKSERRIKEQSDSG